MNGSNQKITAGYPQIPDHSDSRGFTYRAPSNYDWADDHEVPTTRPASEKLWQSVRGFAGRGPKGYRRPDESIREEICESLMEHAGIDASGFEVTVSQGIATLRGKVPDRWMKRASEWVVEGVSGVRDIRNELNLH